MVKMHGPYDAIAWGEKSYRKDSTGAIEVPAEAVNDLLALGMKLGTPTSIAATPAPAAPKPETMPVETTPSESKPKRKRG